MSGIALITCVYCNQPFQKRNKGLKLYGVGTNVCANFTVYDILVELSKEPQNGGFVCQTCYSLICRFGKLREKAQCVKDELRERCFSPCVGFKRKSSEEEASGATSAKQVVFQLPPKVTTSMQPVVEKTDAEKSTFIDVAINHIKKYNYWSGIKHLLKNSRKFRDVFHRLLVHESRQEVSFYWKTSRIPSQETTIENIKKFQWFRFLNETRKHLPILHAVIEGSLSNRLSADKICIDDDGKCGSLVPGLGFTIGTILNLRKPKKFNFLQNINALQMYRSGCNQKHELSANCDSSMHTDDSVHSSLISEFDESAESDHTKSTNGSDEDCVSMSPDGASDIEDDVETFEREPGYSLCWDNVQKLSEARHQSQKVKNKMMLWALSFATKNRISFRDYDDIRTKKAVDIPVAVFLPSQSDWTRVNLGVIKANPSSSKGVIEIMRHLGQYVPSQNGKPLYNVVCHGDQLSIERMVDARFSMACSQDHVNRLVGLEPRPQEFHKRCITMQDTMNKLFSGSSASARGSLFHVKIKFGHRAVKKKVIDDVNHTVDCLNFMTEGYTCILAMHLRRLTSLCDKPTIQPDQQKDYVEKLAEEIVSFIWPDVDEVPLSDSDQQPCIDNYDDEDDDYCVCKTDLGGTMIECSALSQCKRGRWFHLDCVELQPESVPDDEWWCSPDCEQSSIYCFCKKKEDTDDDKWIGCDREFMCPNGEWFHMRCVGLNQCPDGSWFCSDDCQVKGPLSKPDQDTGADYLFNYSCHVLWRGLFHMAERDAERENDGPAMMSNWRVSMLDFWENNHYKYLIIGHRLLACINGYVSPRQGEEMLWNSTANLKGGAGNNIPLDLVNEYLNNDFKQNLKHCDGRYTNTHVARCSQLVGRLATDLECVYMTKFMDEYVHKSKTTSANYRRDVSKFVKEYRDDGIFQQIPGRYHAGFSNFRNKVAIHSGDKLVSRLKSHCRTLDLLKEILPQD
ncbi:uncharacterized protein LOC100373840 [Saccoglossus kowalevskii]